MLRVLSLLGLLSPVLGAVVLMVFRRRAPGPAALGLIACVLALLASGVGLVAERTAFLGGDLEGMTRHVETTGLVRLLLMGLAVLILLGAAAMGRHVSSTWYAAAGAGLVLCLAGAATPLLSVDLGTEHEGLTLLAAMLVEAVRFALIGAGTLLLCLGVVSSRPAAKGPEEEPLVLAGRSAQRAWRLYQQLGARRR